jgi:hypothetical protein
MIAPAADNLRQIVALFQLTKPVPVPLTADDGAVVQGMDLAEVAALSLALGFFLRQTGNRAERPRPAKKSNLESISQ